MTGKHELSRCQSHYLEGDSRLNRLKKLVDIARSSNMTDAQKRRAFNDIGSLAVRERLIETELEELRKYIE